jgi:heme a synthase
MNAATTTSADLGSPRASVATWLGVLFVIVLLLVSVGGYVRLSGSGLSIPGWPVITIEEGRWTLWPPISDNDWRLLHQHFEQDQLRLREEIRSQGAYIGSLGRQPESLSAFKTMFLVEWSHRFVAALTGLIAAACFAVMLRHPALRREVGVLFGVTCALIVVQAVIGGALVKSGTATHWLFVHLGTAALILGLVVWSILTLLSASQPRPNTSTLAARGGMKGLVTLAIAMAWCQIMLGALVAGSRGEDSVMLGNNAFSTTWPKMMNHWIPDLWVEQKSVVWNLLDNPWLHQWAHRWFAAAFALVMIGLYIHTVVKRTPIGPRLRLSLKVSASFLLAQIVLGLANVLLTHPTLVSLSHLVMGMFLFASLVLMRFDIVHEAEDSVVAPETPSIPGAVAV